MAACNPKCAGNAIDVFGNVPILMPKMKSGLSLFLFPALLLGTLEISAQSTNTPAHAARLKFMRGVSLGNYLEYVPNTIGNVVYTIQDIELIRAEGFDHVRVPVGWHLYTDSAPGFTLSNTIFAKVDFLLTNSLNNGLSVLLDLHNFDAFMAAPAANTNKFYAIWRQVAEYYANAPLTVAFELLNEPHDPATTTAINPIYAEAIRQIRMISPDRAIFVGPGNYNSLDDLYSLVLPANATNLIAAVHFYDPYYFTHQGAEWALPDTATTGVLFPGPPAVPLKVNSSITHSWVLDWFRMYNTLPTTSNPSSSFAFRSRLQRARTWSEFYGRPVHVGEFGCYEKSDPQSRVNFYREIRQTMDEFGLGWAMWDWKSGFHYIKSGRPDPPGIREAMFPPIELKSQSKGTVEFAAAVGKTFLVEKAESLTPPIFWRPVSTQTLTSPKFIFNDSGPNTQAGGFYRVQWLK